MFLSLTVYVFLVALILCFNRGAALLNAQYDEQIAQIMIPEIQEV